MKELKDFKGYFVSEDGCVYHMRSGVLKKLAPRYTNQGYTRVLIDGRDYYIHRLVVQAYIGDIPKGMTVNHKNFIKDDNRVENLEILSMYDNIQHYVKARRKGEI